MSFVGDLPNENYMPTRKEIADLLRGVARAGAVSQEARRLRNSQRRSAVAVALNQKGLPKAIQDRILSDIVDYPEWERDDEFTTRFV